MELARRIRYSNSRWAVFLRSVYFAPRRVSLPAPRVVVRPLVMIFVALRQIMHFVRRVFIAEPFFKSYCTRYGTDLHTDIFLHWIQGRGEILIGDHVTVDGRCSFVFSARYEARPRLTIGDYSGISHECSIVVAKEIEIGDHCRIASGVILFDFPGHPADPKARMAGDPALPEEVRPIKISDNVWIGKRSIIFPGVKIGENSIVASGSVVVSDVPPNSLVAGNPARVVRKLVPTVSSWTGKAYDTVCAGSITVEDIAGARGLGATMGPKLLEDVLEIIRNIRGMRTLSGDDEFYEAGLSSMDAVGIMLELEERYQVKIPDEHFLRCRTASRLAALISELLRGVPVE